MKNAIDYQSRRTFIQLAGLAAAGCSLMYLGGAWVKAESGIAIPLFDGKTLDGWIQIENDATSLSVNGITDQSAFAGKLANGTDPVSVFLRGKLEALVKVDLASYSPSNANAKALMSTLAENINQVISGPSIYDVARFSQIDLRPETEQLLQQNVYGPQLARLNKLLLEDAYPAELAKSTTRGWVVKDGVMASTGAGRGVIYTMNDYKHYRLMLTMRHVSGKPDHPACVLIFCTRPQPGEMPLDALGGIQFDVPGGGRWDYRPGMNNDGGAEYTTLSKPAFNVHDWSRIELLVNATTGTARMAVAQPPGSRAIEALDFKDETAGRVGPIALQMHNAGLFDEYKDLSIELNPREDALITTG
ncbi:MAG: family 16 glycoside hydrolase [Terracidiphilus sp.]